MAAEQGEDTRTGRVPGLNVERIDTTIPADELARALADHFRAQGFEAQVFRTSRDRTAMQARKESPWRNLLGVAYALTVIFTPGEGQLSIGLGGAAGHRVRHLEGEPAGQAGLAGDRRAGQRASRSRPVRCLAAHPRHGRACRQPADAGLSRSGAGHDNGGHGRNALT